MTCGMHACVKRIMVHAEYEDKLRELHFDQQREVGHLKATLERQAQLKKGVLAPAASVLYPSRLAT